MAKMSCCYFGLGISAEGVIHLIRLRPWDSYKEKEKTRC